MYTHNNNKQANKQKTKEGRRTFEFLRLSTDPNLGQSEALLSSFDCQELCSRKRSVQWRGLPFLHRAKVYVSKGSRILKSLLT